MTYHETKKQHVDLSGAHFAGRILDVGGGGEGIISRHSKGRVIAIDKRADELAETPDFGTKIVMDACELGFIDEYFDTITCFYTLMYMDLLQIRKFLKEAYRVSKTGAKFWIWGAVISAPGEASADVFVAQLEVKISEEQMVTTGYGVEWSREQSFHTIKNMCEECGFDYEDGAEDEESFFLCFVRR